MMIRRILQTKENLQFDILADINDDAVYNFIIDSLKIETDSPYSALLETIFHYAIAEDDAKKLWMAILKNQKEMSLRLGRKVSIKTAVVDYFTSQGMDDSLVVFIKDNVVNVIDAATRDGLTGLFTHEYIDAELDREFLRAKRYNLALSVMFIDIDDFKKYNDNYGHKVGDRVLMTVGELLRRSIRQTDKIGRYGGEEFLVILPHTGRNNIIKIGKKVVSNICRYTADGEQFPEGVTVSVGIAELQQGMRDYGELVDAADKAMYKAKIQGKNRCCAC